MTSTPSEQYPYRLTRRGMLAGFAAAAGGAILAACGGSSPTATPAPTVAPTRAAGSAAAPTTAAATTAPAASAVAPTTAAATTAPTVAGSAAAPTTAAGSAAAPTTAPAASAAPTVQAKPGGTLSLRYWTADPPDLDPYLNVSFRAQEFAAFFYSRLLKYDSGPGIAPTSYTPVPDLAEKFTVSQDGLTYTFTLRANAKWQKAAPMNGRAVTADDVVYSFNRFKEKSAQNSFSMVADVKATDPRTVVFTLNTVFAPFDSLIASPALYIMPKEVIDADGDARKRVVGSGPFIFDRFEKGVQVVAKRNPDYYLAPTPYVDELDLLIVPQDATAVANMRAKQIDINGVSIPDAKALKSSNPEIVQFKYPTNLLYFMYWRLDAPPFNDVRVRQAVSLAIDRDELLTVLSDGEGYMNNAIPAGLPSWWLDPRGADMGPSSKFFKRDVDAAKKLLADAGFSGGLKVPLISSLNAYGDVFNQSIDTVIKQLKDAGIQADFRPQDYAAYIASTFLGKFDGGTMVWGLETPYPEPNDYLYNMYHPKGARNHAGVNDPQLQTMIEKQSQTLDKGQRKSQIFDIQRYLGEKQYYVIGPVGPTVIVYQPWVKNFYYTAGYGRGAEYIPQLFLDGKK